MIKIKTKIIICSLLFLFISSSGFSKPLAVFLPETTAADTITDADVFYDQANNKVVNIMSPFISADSAIMAIQLCSSGTPQDSFYDGFESGGGNWVTALLQGTQDPWSIYNLAAISGTQSLLGSDLESVSNTCKQMKTGVAVPANAFMHFQSGYDFEYSCDPDLGCEYFDGGIVQYSTNVGTSWTDAGSLFIENGYNGTIAGSYGNPLATRSAFVGYSETIKSHKLNLSTLSGQNILFRFCIGTDEGNFGTPFGWLIDDVRIYKCVTSTTTTASPSTTTTTAIVTSTTTSVKTTTTTSIMPTTTTSIRPTTTTSIRPTTTTSSVRPTTTTSQPANDADNDGILNVDDNCPNKANGPTLGTCNPASGNAGTACTSDAQCTSGCASNGHCDMNQEDADNDGVGDVCDNCLEKPNGYLLGTCSPWSGSPGVVCESDNDCTATCTGVRACNMNQEDTDHDGFGDGCDNCPNNCNTLQKDADGDGIGDVCDPTPGCGGCSGIGCEQQC